MNTRVRLITTLWFLLGLSFLICSLILNLHSTCVEKGSDSPLKCPPLKLSIDLGSVLKLNLLDGVITFCSNFHRSAGVALKHSGSHAQPGLCSYGQTTFCCLGWISVNGICQCKSAIQ